MMTYEEVIAFGLKHYAHGGDSVVECLSRRDYEEEIHEGYVFTEETLLQRFHIFDEIRRDIQSYADF